MTKRAVEIQPWDSDHTALVHVLWSAQRKGLSISDADELASHIMQSEWMEAALAHAREREIEVLRDALKWARATFDLMAIPNYGDAVDHFIDRYDLKPLGGSRPHRKK